MKPIILKLIADAHGSYQDIVILSNKSSVDLKPFTDMYFDIMKFSSLHNYKGDTHDAYAVAQYVKDKLNISDEDLCVIKPEVITEYY